MGSTQNYFDVLGVPRDATADEIRRAYRRLVRELHPDTNPASKENPERFILVQEAFEVLNTPLKRRKYESELPPERFNIQVQAIYSRSSLVKIKEPQLIFALLEIAAPKDAENAPAPQ